MSLERQLTPDLGHVAPLEIAVVPYDQGWWKPLGFPKNKAGYETLISLGGVGRLTSHDNISPKKRWSSHSIIWAKLIGISSVTAMCFLVPLAF